MHKKTKKITKFALRLILTTTLLLWVFNHIDLNKLTQNIKAATWQYLLIVWFLRILGFWIRSIKMRYILKRQNCDVTTTKIFTASAATSLYSLIMPGLLSTGIKWGILKHHTGKGTNVLSAMMYSQLTELTIKLLLGLIAITIANPFNTWQVSAFSFSTALLIILICILLLNTTTGPKISNILTLTLSPLPKIIRAKSQTILDQLKIFQTTNFSFHIAITAITFLDNLIMVLMFIFAAKAASIFVPPIALAWQSSAIFILGRLPISISNLGVREFTLIEFLKPYGVASSSVLLMSMIIFSANIVMAAIGAAQQITWALRTKKTPHQQP